MKQGSKNKSRKVRKQYDPLFSQSIKDAVAHFSVSETYVRNSVNGTETGGISDDIKKFVATQLEKYKSINQN